MGIPSRSSAIATLSLILLSLPTLIFATYTPLPLPLIELKLGRDRNIQLGAGDPFNDVQSLGVVAQDGTELPPYDTVYYFEQLIDHNHPEVGTFQQRYYFTYEFYEAGGPIFLNAPSETNLEKVDGSITNASINGYLAQSNRGAAVVLEHRFFGQSNPYPTLMEKYLETLTVNQTIADIVYFASKVNLTMPGGETVGPDAAPWVIVGGSYAGSLVAWTMTQFPGIFAAGWASSAVIEAMNYHWAYFEIIRQNIPANCSADLELVINHLDQVFTNGSVTDQNKIKDSFGLSVLKYADEFLSAIRAPLWSWQDIQPTYEDPNAGFHAFCNFMEYNRTVGTYETAGLGLGLDHAMDAYANWTKFEIRQANCLGNEAGCYGTHDNRDSLWSDTRIGLNFRSWAWIYCNEFGWLFSGSPLDWPSLTSRLTNPDTEMRSCSLYFPTTFPPGTKADAVLNNTVFNNKYGGWDIKTENVFFANGKKDPWRGVTLSSDFHFRNSTRKQPIAVAKNGFHCTDQVMSEGEAEPSVKAVQQLGAAYIYLWLTQWYDKHPTVKRPAGVRVWPDPESLWHPTISATSIPPDVINAPPYGNARSANSTDSSPSDNGMTIYRSSSVRRYPAVGVATVAPPFMLLVLYSLGIS